MSLEEKVAIVTGASRGIGKAMAMGLAREGAAVVIAARSEQPRSGLPGTIHGTVSEIEDAGGRALAVPCNVSDYHSIRELVEQALDAYGAVDVLINNAGLGGYTPFLQLSVKEWGLTMDIDVRAPFITCKGMAPMMI